MPEVSPRAINRMRALLRIAQPQSGASSREREVALKEALRMIEDAAASRETTTWVEMVPMRFEPCELCPETIRPAIKALVSSTGAPPKWRHLVCHARSEE